MKLRLAQLIVADDIDINFQKIKAVLGVSEAEEWVTFPEGMLSGYSPADNEYIDKLSWEKIGKYKSEIARIVTSRKNRWRCHLPRHPYRKRNAEGAMANGFPG